MKKYKIIVSGIIITACTYMSIGCSGETPYGILDIDQLCGDIFVLNTGDNVIINNGGPVTVAPPAENPNPNGGGLQSRLSGDLSDNTSFPVICAAVLKAVSENKIPETMYKAARVNIEPMSGFENVKYNISINPDLLLESIVSDSRKSDENVCEHFEDLNSHLATIYPELSNETETLQFTSELITSRLVNYCNVDSNSL